MARPSKLRRYRALVVAVAAATAMTACSSTNDTKADSSSGGDTSSAAPSPTPSLLRGANGQALTKKQIIAAVKAGTLPKSALNSVAAAPTTTGSPKPGGTTTGSSPASKAGTTAAAPVGPGVTDTEIKIGFSTFRVGDFVKQFGYDIDPGDNEAQIKAVVNYVNAHGGVAGRKVVPSIFVVDFSKANGVDGQFEADACAKWTEDDKAFAVVNLSLNRPQFAPCLAKKGVIGIQQGLQSDAARIAPYHRYYYTTMAGSGVLMDRAARTETKALCAKGWFKDATVGFIYYDDPGFRDVVDKTYEPAMKACGMKKLVRQAAGRGGTNPDAQFVARFQTEGVDHVMFMAEGGGYPQFFMPAAESQQYRPFYSLRSDMAPALLLQSPNIPEAQLKKATGTGWSPLQDVDAARDPGPTNAGDRLCVDIMTKASLDMSNRAARFAAGGYCSGLLFIQQALAHASGPNAAAFQQSAEQLGSSFLSATTFGNLFNKSQHDGPSIYREFNYDSAKHAFQYVSGNKPMSG